MSRDPARSRSAIASARIAGGVQAGQLGGAQGPPQPLRLVAGFAAVAGRQGVHEQGAVGLLPGRGGLGGPDRMQDGQVVRVGQGLVAGLGGRALLAVAVQHPGQHGQRLPRRRGPGRAAGGGGAAVVAGELGGRARAGHRVGGLGRGGEHVGEVDVSAAAQRDIRVLAVFGPGDHGQAGVHGAALGGVVGDRISQFGIFVVLEHKVSVGPAALPGYRVGVQGPADEQAAPGDGLDTEQVAVGQGPAGLAGLDAVVVAGADDQVAGTGPGGVGDGDCGAAGDDAHGDEVLADAAVQLAAQRVIRRHQQRVGAAGGQGDVCGRGGIHHLLRLAADDPGVLVILGQHAGVPVAQPQAGGLFPGGAEPDGFGQPGVAQRLRRAGTCRRRSRPPAAG